MWVRWCHLLRGKNMQQNIHAYYPFHGNKQKRSGLDLGFGTSMLLLYIIVIDNWQMGCVVFTTVLEIWMLCVGQPMRTIFLDFTTSMYIASCYYLEDIPSGIGEIPTFQLIKLDCTESTVASAKRIVEEQSEYDKYNLNLRISNKISNRWRW